ncbi:hypothetical protein SFRURICE_017235 [Spodoptera frugiperda]|nr:hypothetical protein SFRURICE_017235 [Spodoptera frugiperda]
MTPVPLRFVSTGLQPGFDYTGKMGLPAGGGLSLFCPGGELGQPPPAHMGIPPPYQLDSKLAAGLARTPMYPFPGGTYPYPMLSPEMSQVAASWHTPTMYPISSAASGFRSPYPTSLPISSSSLSSELYRFSPTLGGGLGLGLGPALVPPPPSKSDLDSHHSRYASREEQAKYYEKARQERQLHMQLYPGWSARDNYGYGSKKKKRKKDRSPAELGGDKIVRLGRRSPVASTCPGRVHRHSAFLCFLSIFGAFTIQWHALGREEQAKYYELARRERQLHMQLYPDWSSRANTQRGKKRKRKQETTDGGTAFHSVDERPSPSSPIPVTPTVLSHPASKQFKEVSSEIRSRPTEVRNIKPNSIPFSSFNIHAIRMQWVLVLQLKSTKFHNINVDRAEFYLRENPSSLSMSLKRKKKCVRYMEALAAASGTVPMPMATPQSPCSEEDVKLEEMSDASSDGDADTPLNSASSPGALSALSSLASPASEPAPAPRHPVGTNPRDANNPLSVGQLTSQSWPRAAPRPGHEVISVS